MSHTAANATSWPIRRRLLFLARLTFALSMTLGTLTLFAGCSPSADASANGRPKVLRIAFTVSDETVEERTKAYGDLARYLGEKLGMRVEAVETQGYGTTIEALRSGKIDICSGSPMPYLIAQTKMDVVPLVVPAMPGGDATSYNSMFVTHRGSGLRSMEDVKARAASLVLAFVDPASTSGHLIPRGHLESLGLDAERDFQRVIFTITHLASVMTVKSGKVDVSAISKTSYDRYIRDGRLRADELVVLWISPPMHQSVIYGRGSLPVDLREEIRRIYVDLGTVRPDLFHALRTNSTSGATGYMPAEDSMFDEFRRLARNLEHIQLLD